MTDQDPGLAAIFSTYPSPYLSVFGSILDQVHLIFKFFNIKMLIEYDFGISRQ